MENTAVRFIFAFVAVAASLSCSTGFVKNGTAPSARSSGTQSSNATAKLDADTVEVLRAAAKNYPVPYVRTALGSMFRAIDAKEVTLAFVHASQATYPQQWVRYRRSANDPPVIEINTAHIVASFMIASKLNLGSGLTDNDLQDWLVMFAVKEWYRLDQDKMTPVSFDKLRRAGKLADYVLLTESAAWFDGYEKVIRPAHAAGRFRSPLAMSGAMLIYCYNKTAGDYTDPAWESFIVWTLYAGAREPDCAK